jgi:hypothetical protein
VREAWLTAVALPRRETLTVAALSVTLAIVRAREG